MRKQVFLFVCFLFLSFCDVLAGINYGFGVGYILENIYIDSEKITETEKRVPLLGVSLGFDLNASIVKVVADTKADFFGMDLFRGNTEYSLFLEPKAVVTIPITVSGISLSPIVGYGGIYKKKYIKDRYTVGKEPLLITKNSTDYDMELFDVLFGGMLSSKEWINVSFISGKDVKEFHEVTMWLRTPQSENSVPFITIKYTGGEETKIFTFGLSFER
jgi:hypothetical protein